MMTAQSNVRLAIPPLGLYIHLPWCMKKCPYCDFNSHAIHQSPLQETDYVQALIQELLARKTEFEGRAWSSIFIGGGTPSLFQAGSIGQILEACNHMNPFLNHLEITLEANPGTFERKRFADFFQVGINRLSVGVQSFNNQHLKTLGRIHSSEEAQKALIQAHEIGFKRINIDLMYGLPQQSVEEACDDLKLAGLCEPTHLSWYQLTLEPNTVFYRRPPAGLPQEDLIMAMETAGHAWIAEHGFQRYEISAYSKHIDQQCQHNLNYWTFGDYLGLGAGAHSKITCLNRKNVARSQNTRIPKDYLQNPTNSQIEKRILSEDDLRFEFMLNALRLIDPIPFNLFESRTGLGKAVIQPYLAQGKIQELLDYTDSHCFLTPLGRQFTDNAILLFN